MSAAAQSSDAQATTRTSDERKVPLYDELRCCLSGGAHFLVEPRLLPCAHAACLDCAAERRQLALDAARTAQIATANADAFVTCGRCGVHHTIDSLDELKSSDDSLVDLLRAHTDEIGQELLDQLNERIRRLTLTCESGEAAIEQICAQTKREIADRIAAIKAHLNVLRDQLLSELAAIRRDAERELAELGQRMDERMAAAQHFVDNNRSGDSERERDSGPNQSQRRQHESGALSGAQLLEAINECTEYIDDLVGIDDKFRQILHKITFEPSDWEPDVAFLCAHVGHIALPGDTDINDDDDQNRAEDKNPATT